MNQFPEVGFAETHFQHTTSEKYSRPKLTQFLQCWFCLEGFRLSLAGNYVAGKILRVVDCRFCFVFLQHLVSVLRLVGYRFPIAGNQMRIVISGLRATIS